MLEKTITYFKKKKESFVLLHGTRIKIIYIIIIDPMSEIIDPIIKEI